MKFHKLCWVVLVAFSQPLFANDAVEAGISDDLVFEKTAEVIIKSEVLKISKTAEQGFNNDETLRVDVDFQIENISDKPIKRKIVFALPPVWCNQEHNSLWMGLDKQSAENQSFKDYQLLVNGKPTEYKERTIALLEGKNVSDVLEKIKIPQNPCRINFTYDDQGNPIGPTSDILKKNNLLNEAGDPAWAQNIYFEWEQEFPAHQSVHIQHRYTPVAGRIVPVNYTAESLDGWFNQETPQMQPIWNRNPATLAKTNSLLTFKVDTGDGKKAENGFCLIPTWLKYRLTTGAYWNGGIRDFKLIITDEGGAPFAVNKFYTDNDNVMQTTKDNTMVFTAKNFTPSQDLLVLFLQLPQTLDELKTCGN